MWVRCFEDRTDLVRAALLGPADTPYEDGLYFFDFQFPAGYPADPPVRWVDHP